MFGWNEARAAQEAMRRLAGGLDPAGLTVAEAGALLGVAVAVEKLAATVKALVAARLAEVVGPGSGEGAVAERLARESGAPLGTARAVVETGRRLGALPLVAAAARDGSLSAAQAAAIARAAAANPAAEGRLVELAARSSVAELVGECERARAAGDADAEARRRRVHAERRARRRLCLDGAGEITYRATVDDVAAVWAVIEGYGRAAFDRARIEGRSEPAEAYLADGMRDMARVAGEAGEGHRGQRIAAETDVDAEATGGRPPTGWAPAGSKGRRRVRRPAPTKVIVRVDWEALVRGRPLDGELCEIAGAGPVPVAVVRALVGSGDAFVAAVLTKGRDVVNVAHLVRRPSAHQMTALEWRGPECTVAGCTRRARLEIDHRVDWRLTHHTRLDELEWLCGHHHDLKSRRGWALVAGSGKRDMVRPGDPRHPGDGARPGSVGATAGPARGRPDGAREERAPP